MQVPCISNLNNKEMIIKDSLVPLKDDTRSLSNTYRGLHGKMNKRCEKLKTFMVRILKLAFEFGKQAAKFLSTSHHINPSSVSNMY